MARDRGRGRRGRPGDVVLPRRQRGRGGALARAGRRERPRRSSRRSSSPNSRSTQSRRRATPTPSSPSCGKTTCSPNETAARSPDLARRVVDAPGAARGAPRPRQQELALPALSEPPSLPPSSARGVRVVLRNRPNSCLERALVLQRWEAAQGYPRDVVIGVTAPDDFKAHAWLDGDPSESGEFAELLRAPGRVTMELTPLEVACGLVLGRAPRPLPPADGLDPLATLEALVRPALERPPCLVSFSGGRDSSAVLAVATALARREGLALPVPATHRFRRGGGDRRAGMAGAGRRARSGSTTGCGSTTRTSWISSAPSRRPRCSRHGLLWPPNAHFHAPLLEAAAGGSLLTGIGGDEAFSESQWSRARAVASGKREARAARRVAPRRSPSRPRGSGDACCAGGCRAGSAGFGPKRSDAVWDALIAESATEPLGWRRRIRWLAGARYLQAGIDSLALLGADAGRAGRPSRSPTRASSPRSPRSRASERFGRPHGCDAVALRRSAPGRRPRAREQGLLRRRVLAPAQPRVRGLLGRARGGHGPRRPRRAASRMGEGAPGRAHLHAAPGRVARAARASGRVEHVEQPLTRIGQ